MTQLVEKKEQKNQSSTISLAISPVLNAELKRIRPPTTQDNDSDFRDYQSAAEAGNALAHYYLGRCYETGRGVAANSSYALYCFRVALAHHPKARAAYLRMLSISPTGMTSVSSIPTLKSGEFKKIESKKIGKGSEGDVYEDQWQDERVAVKYLEVPISDVQRQIQHLAEFKTNQSEYLMQVKALCLTPSCLVLEYIPGKNLTDFLKTNPHLSWLRRYRLAHDIIQGVAYLHPHLLHRDLKSVNIMVVEGSRLHTKLCDFGSLKKAQAQETGMTNDKATMLYLDPEYLYSKSPINYAWYHDIYSLGRILLEIATSESPSPAYMHKRVVYTKGVALAKTIPKNCPKDFAQLIRDCWRYPSSSRPQATELVERMTTLLKAEQYQLANNLDEKKHTPLINAICNGKTGKVATLLDCKAKIDQVDSRGGAPLFWAERSGKHASGMIRLLLEAKAVVPLRNAEAYYNRGNSKNSKGDYQGAIADYSEAIRLKRGWVEAYINRGYSKASQGDYQGAIADSSEAIRLKPDWAEAYYNRGLSKYNQGDYQGAIADSSEAIRLKSDYAEAYYNRGISKHNQGDYQGAIADFSKAIRLKLNWAEAYTYRGYSKASQGDDIGAIADFSEVIRLKPNDAEAYHARGISKNSQSDYQGAIADFSETIRLKPDAAAAFNGRGFTKLIDDYSGALEDLTQALHLRPDSAVTYNNRALLFELQGEQKKRLADREQAATLELQQYTPVVKLELSKQYMKMADFITARGEGAKAVVFYNEAIRLSPDFVEAYYHRGFAKYTVGDRDGAKMDYAKSISLQPSLAKKHADFTSAYEALSKNLTNFLTAPTLVTEFSSPSTSALSTAITDSNSATQLEADSHSISSPQEILQDSTQSQECKKAETCSTSTSDFSSSSGSIASTAGPSLSSASPNLLASNFTFFQKQKPAVIKNATSPELKRCIKTFQALFDEHHYTFTVKRSLPTQLLVQFTARNKVTEDHEKVTGQLRAAATAFQQLVRASGIPLNPSQFKLNWEHWTLTVDATSSEIDAIAWCLQQASGHYIAENKHSFISDYEAVCRLQ